jgi:hypothetical protein
MGQNSSVILIERQVFSKMMKREQFLGQSTKGRKGTIPDVREPLG